MNTEDLLKDLYKLGNKEVKDKLELEHPTLFKTKLLIDEAIEALGESDKDVIKLGKLLSILDDNDRLVAEQKLIIVIKYKNNGWVADFDDNKQGKYYVWFYLGVNFCYYRWNYCISYSNVPASLCLKNKELCKELANNEEVVNYYNLYLNK